MLLLYEVRLFLTRVRTLFSEHAELPENRSPFFISKVLEIAWVTDLIRD